MQARQPDKLGGYMQIAIKRKLTCRKQQKVYFKKQVLQLILCILRQCIITESQGKSFEIFEELQVTRAALFGMLSQRCGGDGLELLLVSDWGCSVHAGGSAPSASALPPKRVEGDGAAASQQRPDVIHGHDLLRGPSAQPRHCWDHRHGHSQKIYQEVSAPVAQLGGTSVLTCSLTLLRIVLVSLQLCGFLPDWKWVCRLGLAGEGLCGPRPVSW